MYSFDVYDTLIARKVSDSQGIFDVMSYILLAEINDWKLESSFAADFLPIRTNAEKIARTRRKAEVTIEDIYAVIENNYQLNREVCNKLIQLEMKIEKENSVPIWENINKLLRLKKQREHIVLISDMYLPKNFFYDLFEKVCPELKNINLYVSCEENKTKSTGLLYEHIAQVEDVNYSEWIHIGDNVISDVNVPALLGIKTERYIRYHNEMTLERIAKICLGERNFVKQYMLGIIKNNSENNISYNIGLSLAGVILYSYVKWIISVSLQKKISKLGFIARDGYILKQIADIIIEKCDYPIETQYVYGSRKAWRTEEKDKISLVNEYIHGIFGDDLSAIALVDTQGTGISISSLSNICKHCFIAFYFSLIENQESLNIDAYSYTHKTGMGIIEAFCRAPHGATIGYQKIGGIVQPIIAQMNDNIFDKAEYEKYVDGIIDFVKEMLVIDSTLVGGVPLRSASEKIFDYCCNPADVQLAGFIGDMPHDDDNIEKLYAPKLTRQDIRKIELERTTEDISKVYKGSELNISYRRLNDELREYLDTCRKNYLKNQKMKDANAKVVVIFGFGKYGQELYHKLYNATNVIVKYVVDSDTDRYCDELIKVYAPTCLKSTDYDYVIISPKNAKLCEDIKTLLLMAGIPIHKIVYRTDAERMFIKEG